MKKYLLLSLAALISVQASSSPTAAAGGAEDSARKELKRRPSFRALEAYRSERPAASVLAEREYYEDTDASVGTPGMPGRVRKYRPYAPMHDITEAGQSSAKLVEGMNQDEDTPRRAAPAMGGMPGMMPKEYPFSEEFRELQRASDDVERRMDGSVRYKKAVGSAGEAIYKAVPKAMPKPEIKAALDKVTAVYEKNAANKKEFFKKLADLVPATGGAMARLPAENALYQELMAVANGTSTRVKEDLMMGPGGGLASSSDFYVVAELMKDVLALAKEAGKKEAERR